MKRLVLALVVLAAAFGLWYASESLHTDSQSATTLADDLEGAADRPVSPAGLDEKPIAPVVAEAAESSARSTAPDEPEVDLHTATIVTVATTLPTGTPTDEELTVFAWREEPNERELARELSSSKDADLVGRGLPTGEGRFELPFPKDYARGWITVRGRYSFSAQAVSVDLTTPKPEVAIPLELGAWVRGRITLPTEVPAAQVAGLEVELQPDPMAAAGAGINPFLGATIEREALVRDLTFEYRGVHPGRGWTLQVVPDDLAAHKSRPLELVPGGRYDVEIALMHGGRITGRIVDPAGQPVEGADIDATQHPVWFGAGGIDVRSAFSNADGEFELPRSRPAKRPSRSTPMATSRRTRSSR